MAGDYTINRDVDSLGEFPEAYISLESRISITRECRYAAQKRLNRRHQRAYYVVALLSLFVIVLSVLPNVHDFSNHGIQALLLITIVDSVFIIITSLVDVREDYSLKAYQMRQSCSDLDELFNELEIASDSDKKDITWISKLQVKYQDVLSRCPSSHEDIDFTAAQVKKPHLFEYSWRKQCVRERRARNVYRSIYLHWARSRWLVPHLVFFLASMLAIFELWNEDFSFLSHWISKVAEFVSDWWAYLVSLCLIFSVLLVLNFSSAVSESSSAESKSNSTEPESDTAV